MREYHTGEMDYYSFDTEYEMKKKLEEFRKTYGKNKSIVSGPIDTVEGKKYFISIKNE